MEAKYQKSSAGFTGSNISLSQKFLQCKEKYAMIMILEEYFINQKPSFKYKPNNKGYAIHIQRKNEKNYYHL